MLPKELHKFFWEHNPAELEEKTYWYFTIERLLEHGNDQAIRWVFKHYPQEKLLKLLNPAGRFPGKRQIFGRISST